MSRPSDLHYLESKILTASQPRMHLTLLEGAVRFGQQAKLTWNVYEAFAETEQWLNRMMDVIEELTMSTSAGETEISKQLEEQYAFLYREIAASRFDRDLEKFNECLNLLEFHRETWKKVCDNMATEEPAPAKPAVIPPHHLSPNTSDSFSIEA